MHGILSILLDERGPCKSMERWTEFWDQFKSRYELLVDREAKNGISGGKIYMELHGNVFHLNDFSFSMSIV